KNYDSSRFRTTSCGRNRQAALRAPLLLPTGLFQQTRKFVRPMWIAQPEWPQGIARRLFQLAHLLDARSCFLQPTKRSVAAGECLVGRPPCRANLSTLDGCGKRVISPAGKKVSQR